MSFLNMQFKLNYYDQIIDEYNINNFETARKLIRGLNLTDKQNFLYWLYKNHENINDSELIAFILDEIF
jgi:hypothetical protein